MVKRVLVSLLLCALLAQSRWACPHAEPYQPAPPSIVQLGTLFLGTIELTGGMQADYLYQQYTGPLRTLWPAGVQDVAVAPSRDAVLVSAHSKSAVEGMIALTTPFLHAQARASYYKSLLIHQNDTLLLPLTDPHNPLHALQSLLAKDLLEIVPCPAVRQVVVSARNQESIEQLETLIRLLDPRPPAPPSTMSVDLMLVRLAPAVVQALLPWVPPEETEGIAPQMFRMLDAADPLTAWIRNGQARIVSSTRVVVSSADHQVPVTLPNAPAGLRSLTLYPADGPLRAMPDFWNDTMLVQVELPLRASLWMTGSRLVRLDGECPLIANQPIPNAAGTRPTDIYLVLLPHARPASSAPVTTTRRISPPTEHGENCYSDAARPRHP